MSINLARIFKKKPKETLAKEFTGKFDFYGEKGSDLPRLIYRRLYAKLAGNSGREKAITDFIDEVEKTGSKGDALKMKWVLPDYLKAELSEAEFTKIETYLAERRAKKNKKLTEVYPHSADEFGANAEFIDSVFAPQRIELFSKQSHIFTIGSCFARNIARFLESQSYANITPFTQAEDLNSPLSNAKMLAVATAPEAEKIAYLEKWTRAFNPDLKDKEVKKLVDAENERLTGLVKALSQAEVLIITIGNTLDFFIDDSSDTIAAQIPVAPKFLAVMNNENIEFRTSVASQLKKVGAQFRMANYAETKASINTLYNSIRKINHSAPCIITLSPVPIDSAVGIKAELPYGAIELDTISKSTLRTALFELFNEWAVTQKNTYYFPSFEIVRWIGGNLRDIPTFGNEDSASRHVSADILESVYSFFLRRFQKN